MPDCSSVWSISFVRAQLSKQYRNTEMIRYAVNITISDETHNAIAIYNKNTRHTFPRYHDRHMTKAEVHRMDMHISSIRHMHDETLKLPDACNVNHAFKTSSHT